MAAYQNYGVLGSQAGLQGVAPDKRTAFEAVQKASAEVSRVESRIRDLMVRLVGDKPTEGGTNSAVARTAGLFGQMEESADAIARSVSRMDDMISDIERALPASHANPL